MLASMAVASHLVIDLSQYDARIRTFVPDYETMLDHAAVALGAAARPLRRIVDLGTGTGALAARVARSVPDAALVGIDEDEGMLEMARRRLARRHATFLHDSFLRAAFPVCDAMVASLALHHIPTRRARQALFRRMRQAIRPGGLLVSADCHPASNGVLVKQDRAAWKTHIARAYGPKKAEAFLQAWAAEDFYVPLEAELKMLRAAGFGTDVAWRRGAFAVVVAVNR
jgi:tRNA (cmo5U34)-methyltransferase